MSIILAMILDAILGEPRALWNRWPHPAVLMGQAVAWVERRLNSGAARRAKGVFAVLCLSVGAWALGWLLSLLPGQVAEVILGAILIAQKSLAQHVRAVADALALSVGDGRASVAMIVGRDTRAMEEPDIARAAIESAAENFSDGVIAPVFWFALAGLPGLLVYKTVNTADSMIGHRTERFRAFGWAAARLDDLLNLIPARLSAVLIWLSAPRRESWFGIIRDARLHRSPNAGWPEAAMAQVLGVALSGPRSYNGVKQAFPFVNPEGRHEIGAAEIEGSIAVLWRTWALVLALLVLWALLQAVIASLAV